MCLMIRFHICFAPGCWALSGMDVVNKNFVCVASHRRSRSAVVCSSFGLLIANGVPFKALTMAAAAATQQTIEIIYGHVYAHGYNQLELLCV